MKMRLSAVPRLAMSAFVAEGFARFREGAFELLGLLNLSRDMLQFLSPPGLPPLDPQEFVAALFTRPSLNLIS